MPASSKQLTAIFGQQQNRLSAYLRRRLLLQGDIFIVGKQCYDYKLVPGAIAALLAELGEGPPEQTLIPPLITHLQHKHSAELLSFDFNYNDKSYRLWHPLQMLKKDQKALFWAPYLPHDYDIQAAAPNILSQLAARIGLPDLIQQQVIDLRKNPEQWRTRVMDLTGCDRKTAKRILNSLFNGARLARSSFCGAYVALDYDYVAMTRLMTDPEIVQLRSAIKRIWAILATALKTDRIDRKDRWQLYFSQERKVLDTVRRYLADRNNPVFCEHDGFRTRDPIDVLDLQRFIAAQTGYSLRIICNSDIVTS